MLPATGPRPARGGTPGIATGPSARGERINRETPRRRGSATDRLFLPHIRKPARMDHRAGPQHAQGVSVFVIRRGRGGGEGHHLVDGGQTPVRRASLVFLAVLATTSCGNGCQKGRSGNPDCADQLPANASNVNRVDSAPPAPMPIWLGELDSDLPDDDSTGAKVNAEFMKAHPGWRDWAGDYEGSSCAEPGQMGLITPCTSFTIHVENDLAEIREGGFQMLRRYPFFTTVDAQTDHVCFIFDRDAEEKPFAIERKRGDRFGCLYETDTGLVGDGGFAIYNRRPAFSRQKGPPPWPR